MSHLMQKRPTAKCVALILAVILVSGCEAIVKQSVQQQSQQAQRGDDAASVSQSASSSSYGNQQQQHQPQQQQQSQQQQASVSSQQQQASSVSANSGSISGSNVNQQAASSPVSTSNYANGPASSGSKASSIFGLDNLSAASEQPSYQAAASSVTMGLANAGIYPGYQPPSSQQQQQQQSGSQQGLNPLHYYYYPSKESGSSASSAKASGSGLSPIESSSGSQGFQSMSFPTYADTLSALSSMSIPEAAASNQDSSYAPLPSGYAQQPNGNQQQQVGNQQQQQNYNNQDLGAYASSIQQSGQEQPPNQQAQIHQQQPQSQQAGSVSFQGPSGQQQHDFLSSGAHLNPQQQQQPAYQGQNIYNQVGDLSTSNFGNNGNQLASVASYLSPSGQGQQQGLQQPHHLANGGNQHDLFASQAFQSAQNAGLPSASQDQSIASQLFGAASSLHSQQQPSSGGNQGATLFQQQQHQQQANQQQQQPQQSLYNSPYLTPQQYSQLAGQLINDQNQVYPAASQPSASVATAAGGNSKRFGMSSFIMPMLALAGLSLLIPTMSQIGTAVGRKKRSVGEERVSRMERQQDIQYEPHINGKDQLDKETSISEYLDKIERYYALFKNAAADQQCMNRIICEFGYAVRDVTGKSAVIAVIEKLAPESMAKNINVFKKSVMDNKSGKEKCQEYVCPGSEKANRVH